MRASANIRGPAVSTRLESLDGMAADLAIRIASAPADAIDAAVTETLRQVTTRLELEWALIWVRHATDERARVILQAYRERPPSSDTLARLFESHDVVPSLASGEAVWWSRPGDPAGAGAVPDAMPSAIALAAILPLVASEPGSTTALVVGSSAAEQAWPAAAIDLLRVVAAAIGQARARQAGAHALHQALAELQSLRSRRGAAVHTRPAADPAPSHGMIASESPAIRQALMQVEQVAQTGSTVLLLGETGVGKERFARAIHEQSGRGQREMITVSCAAIPSTLIESELFGRERGAYTGALTRQIGRFEAAHGSTLFLDEIGELSSDVQAKLLRMLEERVIERLGSNQAIHVDVRIITATHRNLQQAVAGGAFREDLFYRLNVFPIAIPPLRERVEDIPGLVWTFVDELSTSIGKSIHSIASESMRQLMAYSWPGNIRELRNVIERAVILAKSPVLTIEVPHAANGRRAVTSALLKDVETAHIQAVLELTNWRIRGKDGAAERLGLKPSTLETRLGRLGLARPKSL